jgi:hypothetical protein
MMLRVDHGPRRRLNSDSVARKRLDPLPTRPYVATRARPFSSGRRDARMQKLVTVLIALALLASATRALALDTASAGDGRTGANAARRSYVDGVVARAKALRLSEDRTWIRLLHYRKTLFGGHESEADGAPFFAAKDGKSDPDAELEATLRAFYDGAPVAAGVQHPYCRFPARFGFLDEKLALDRDLLPVKRCPKYEEFTGRLRAKKVILVFSSYYLNNPASAFGHTFLRLGKGDGEGRDLLDAGIDFSATVDTSNALLYAFKGLFGLFPGEFRKIPYAAKVREYNDFESRDLWEYELALTQAEVDRVVAHLWELGSTYFAYYYMSENCSYHILAALEVANPRLRLLDDLGWPVVPADTVKVLYENPGLVRSLRYRPSNRTQFKQRLERLSEEERDAVALVMREPRAALPAELTQTERVRVLDTAIDLADIEAASDLLKKREDMDQERASRQQALLERRAELLVPSENVEFGPPFRLVPQIGHDSTRFGFGSGYSRERGYFHAFSFRLALHDLADPVQGYPDGAQIEFMPGSLRYLVESPRVRLERFSLVRVQSLTPLSRFDRSFSWVVDVGLTRTQDRGCRDCLTGFGEFGAGFALEPFGRAFTIFALADARLFGPVKSGYWDIFRFGAGPAGGLRLRFSDAVTLLGTGSWLYLPLQEPQATWNVEGKLRVGYLKDFALGVEGKLEPEAASVEGVSYIYF